MSTSNPQLNNAINKKASSVASTFSLPSAPPCYTSTTTNTDSKNSSSTIPRIEDGHALPFAAAELQRMLVAQENFMTNTEPSWFSSLPKNTNNTSQRIPQPPPSSSSNPNLTTSAANRGAAFRSALVREAAKFVENPDNFNDAYKRSDTNSNNNEEQAAETSRNSPLFKYDKEYEDKMRNFLLRKSSTDGSSKLDERRRIEESLAKNTHRDHQAFLATQRTESETEETNERSNIESWFAETRALLLSRLAAIIDQHFDEEFNNTRTLERRERLDLTNIQYHKEVCGFQLLFTSEMLFIQFSQSWRDGLDKTSDVLDFVNMQGFVLKQRFAAQILQQCGRGFMQGRRQLGNMRWHSSVGSDAVRGTFLSAEKEFHDAQLALKKRFEMHEVESFERYCRRVILQQAFTGLNTLQFNCTQVMIVLGEYDARRKILVEEEQVVSTEVIPHVVNPIRYDLFLVISHRLKITLQRRFDHCQHVRNAVLVLQNKFFRAALRGKLSGSRSFSKLQLRKALFECIAQAPIRPLSKLTKALRRTILNSEQQQQETVDDEQVDEQQRLKEFERNYAPIVCSEEITRTKMIQLAQESLRRLYNLCFDEGSVAAIAGAGEAKQLIRPSSAEALLLNNNTEMKKAEQQQQQQEIMGGNDQDDENNSNEGDINDERFIGARTVYETILRQDRFTKTKVETEFKFCSSVNRYCLLVTSYQRPAHLNFVHPTTTKESGNQYKLVTRNDDDTPGKFYSRLCRQFLAPSFYSIRPLDFPEIEWYRLRGAVDVSPLIEEACRAGNKAMMSQIYARTIGQLIKRRRATSAEIRKETMQQLQRQALARLTLEMEEWNTRWASALQIFQEHSRLLLSLDWQRTWSTLRDFCEQDEVAMLQYLATQNFEQYRKDVSNVLRGVQKANEEIHKERNWIPRIIATAENRRRRQQFAAKRDEERKFIEEQSRKSPTPHHNNNNNTDISIYDEDDDEEEQNIDFWYHLAKNQNENNNNNKNNIHDEKIPGGAVVLDMYDDIDDMKENIEIQNEKSDENDQDAKTKRLEQEKFYQQLYGDSDEDADIVF